jgi:succinate-semialdehyde dehydrogenase/glutarate-semialdehyde dehydrogenase
MVLEQGKPYPEARGEVIVSADIIDWYAEEGRRSYGRIVPGRGKGVRQLVIQEPIGIVAAFTPWNFPVLTPARKVGGARPCPAAGSGRTASRRRSRTAFRSTRN